MIIPSQPPPHSPKQVKNILGSPLEPCCFAPMTGYFRDGYCRTDATDAGRHLVCVQVTAEFLAFSRAVGNDLSTPRPEFDFPGLKPSDRWCLCALRWKEAFEAGCAPTPILEACHERLLDFIPLHALESHVLPPGS